MIRRSHRVSPTLALTFAIGAAAAGCAARLPASHPEDKARLDVPIAVCLRPLAAAELGDAGAPRPEVFWQVLFPAFRGFGVALRPGERDCVGEARDEAAGGSSPAPRPIGSDDVSLVLVAEAPDVVWLPAFRVSTDAAQGPLALARTQATEVDVYAIGTYRGSARHSRFVLGRLGLARAVVVEDDGCADVRVDVECESRIAVFVVRGGDLALEAETPAQRVRYATVRGLGRVQVRLSTDAPVFDKRTIRIHERLEVRDSRDEDVRRAEGDRVFVLTDDGKLAAQQDSLWAQAPTSP